MSTETPRTDAMAGWVDEDGVLNADAECQDYVPASFARTLERELAAANAALAAARVNEVTLREETIRLDRKLDAAGVK